MATQITNQATLNYTSGTTDVSTSSNTASITLQEPLAVTKYSLENNYQIGTDITYNVFLTNTSTSALTTVTVVDDLGTYAFTTTENVTPLTYVGPAKVYIDGVYSQTVNGTVSAAADSVTFVIDTIAVGSTILLQYECTVNQYAGAVVGTSMIENIVSVTVTDAENPIIASNNIPVASYAKVMIKKAMSPDPVVDGSTLTYTFDISNYGNIPATNVSLQDLFNPDPAIALVTVDGTTTEDYFYGAGIFRYPGAISTETYTIPAATFTQNPTTGIVTVIPGTSTIVVQGTI